MPDELPTRAHEILRKVVAHYILTGEPVGGDGVSPGKGGRQLLDLAPDLLIGDRHLGLQRVDICRLLLAQPRSRGSPLPCSCEGGQSPVPAGVGRGGPLRDLPLAARSMN